MGGHAADQVSTLCEEIRTLLAKPEGHSLQELEDILTEGYARALALESERWRLERRVEELGGDLPGSSEELAAVASRLAHTGERLDALRAVLAALRERADLVRAREAYVTNS